MTSFRVGGKIFATAPADETRLHIFVGEGEIAATVAELPRAFQPLLWGQRVRGLRVLLAAAPDDRVRELLTDAWRRKAGKRLVAEFEEASQGGAMTYETDPRVDDYIDTLPDWQQAVCRELRDIVHAADPEVTETIKRSRQPYFVLEGNICALLAAKDHVNLFLYDGAIVPDPAGIITAGHGNQTARTMAVREGERINANALTAMLRQIIANNRAGGWRKIKAARG